MNISALHPLFSDPVMRIYDVSHIPRVFSRHPAKCIKMKNICTIIYYPYYINLVGQFLDQIYVVLSPQSPPRYDSAPPDAMTFAQSVYSTGSPTASAPMMPLHMLINLT